MATVFKHCAQTCSVTDALGPRQPAKLHGQWSVSVTRTHDVFPQHGHVGLGSSVVSISRAHPAHLSIVRRGVPPPTPSSVLLSSVSQFGMCLLEPVEVGEH
jgi:hypothetical protein